MNGLFISAITSGLVTTEAFEATLSGPDKSSRSAELNTLNDDIEVNPNNPSIDESMSYQDRWEPIISNRAHTVVKRSSEDNNFFGVVARTDDAAHGADYVSTNVEV